MLTLIIRIILFFITPSITHKPQSKQVNARVTYVLPKYFMPVKLESRSRTPSGEVLPSVTYDTISEYKRWKENLHDYQRIREKLIT